MSHRISDDQKELSVKSMTKVLLGLSDQQLITCLAIVIVAISKMGDESFTVYHFSICLDLAWLSSGVHSMTLTVLASYFRRRVKFPEVTYAPGQLPGDNATGKVKKRRLPLLTGVRIVLMSVCLVLLNFTLVISGHRWWYDNFSCPVGCVQKEIRTQYGGNPGRWSTAMIIMSFIANPIEIIILTNRGVRTIRHIRFKHMRKLDEKLKPNSSPDAMLARCYSILKGVATYSWWFYRSIIFNFLTNAFWFVLGVVSLLSDSAGGHALIESQGIENSEFEWVFGQIVPLIFCVLPFITAGEFLWGMSPTKSRPSVAHEILQMNILIDWESWRRLTRNPMNMKKRSR